MPHERYASEQRPQNLQISGPPPHTPAHTFGNTFKRSKRFLSSMHIRPSTSTGCNKPRTLCIWPCSGFSRRAGMSWWSHKESKDSENQQGRSCVVLCGPTIWTNSLSPSNPLRIRRQHADTLVGNFSCVVRAFPKLPGRCKALLPQKVPKTMQNHGFHGSFTSVFHCLKGGLPQLSQACVWQCHDPPARLS